MWGLLVCGYPLVASLHVDVAPWPLTHPCRNILPVPVLSTRLSRFKCLCQGCVLCRCQIPDPTWVTMTSVADSLRSFSVVTPRDFTYPGQAVARRYFDFARTLVPNQ